MDVKLLIEIQNQTGLSNRKMAKRLGLSHQAINKMHYGAECRSSTLVELWKIARDELKWSAKRFLAELEKE